MHRSSCASACVRARSTLGAASCALWRSVGLSGAVNWLHFGRAMFAWRSHRRNHLCHHFVNSNRSSPDQTIELAANDKTVIVLVMHNGTDAHSEKLLSNLLHFLGAALWPHWGRLLFISRCLVLIGIWVAEQGIGHRLPNVLDKLILMPDCGWLLG